jgi:hypothetical protein
MEIYLLTIIFPFTAGLLYGQLLSKASNSKMAILGRLGIVILFLLAYKQLSKSTEHVLLQLEVHHHIMMLITFIVGMWFAIIWQIKARKKNEHTNKYF